MLSRSWQEEEILFLIILKQKQIVSE